MLGQHNDQIRRFSCWLIENKHGLRQGTVEYDGVAISRKTEVTQYHTAMSCLILSIKVPSRFYIVGHETSKITALLLSLCALLIGWWGIPWGPVFTVQSVLSNLAGGKKRRVADLLDELTGYEKIVVHLTERGAKNAVRVMAANGYPPEAGQRLAVEGKDDSRTFTIQYDDFPAGSGREWTGYCYGVPVLVDMALAPSVEGMIIDYVDDKYTFQLPMKAHAPSNNM